MDRQKLLDELDLAWQRCERSRRSFPLDSIDRNSMVERCAAYANVKNYVLKGGSIEPTATEMANER